MRIRVSLPGYRQIEKEIDERKTVGDFKKSLCSQLGIEADLTRLLLNGKTLPEKFRVSKLKRIDNPILIDYLWARHLILWGIKGQQKIRSASVLLAGAGAIGNEVAKNLAMLGVGRILIADHDTVELSNISRMIFFDHSSLGKNKAEVLARNIQKKYPHVETAAYRGDLESMPLKAYLDSDVIVSGLDNVISRIYLTQVSRKYSIPLVDGGIMGFTARIQVYIPPDAACPICIFPPKQYSNIVGLRNPCDAPLEQQTVPSLSTSISLVSSILSQEAIKIIIGLNDYMETGKWPEDGGEPLQAIVFLDLKSNRYTPMPLRRNDACIVCGRDGTTKVPAKRFDLHLNRVRKGLESAIREATHMKKDPLLLFSETSSGERKLDDKGKLRFGDYVRVIAENSNEAICRIS
jgi:molybdopterin/thiamine biosynthesis adenylyltransferase